MFVVGDTPYVSPSDRRVRKIDLIKDHNGNYKLRISLTLKGRWHFFSVGMKLRIHHGQTDKVILRIRKRFWRWFKPWPKSIDLPLNFKNGDVPESFYIDVYKSRLFWFGSMVYRV